jgi:hypothetical protein
MEYVSKTETLRLKIPKGIIRAHKSKKDRHYNDEKKKDKPLSIKLYTEN